MTKITQSLHKKVIVILGGAGLLGGEFARATREAGATVVIADINTKKGSALAKEIGGVFIHTNIADEASLKRLVSSLGGTYAKVDGLVHAAYPKTKTYGMPLETATASDIFENINLQLGGPLLATRSFMPLLKRNASVVFLSSIYGVAAPRLEIYRGLKMGVPAEYAAVKGGIISLTRYFAAVLGKRGARVNAISPGGIFANQPKAFLNAYSRKLLLGKKLLSPSDISGAVVFLLSDASSQMTGQNMIIDGGWTL